MGQQASKSHAPLTFGYINQNVQQEEEASIDESSSRDRYSADFVLANPHLYKLESTCHYCFANTPSTSNKNVVIADQVNLPCENCKKNKRLSLVRRDLASDLSYIDETYYPNTPHYTDDTVIMEELPASPVPESIQEDDEEQHGTNALETEEGWSKLTIGEVTPSTPKRLASSNSLVVDLSGRSLIKLSSSIGYLNNLTKLDLSNNQMVTLPKAIGKLKNLRILNASRNQLEYIPDSITSLSKLKAINLSQNKLSKLPKGIGQLPCLIIIILNNNQFIELPREIANLNELMTLNVSNNPLKTIPAEITALKSLKKLLTENCPFDEEMNFPLQHDPPSLLELCARTIVKQRISLPTNLLHPSIVDYFKKEQTCSFCSGPYFDAYVTRGRFIERMGRQVIALDYRLCCAHWSDENDRLTALFSNPYNTPHPINNFELVESPIQQEGDSEQEDYFNHHQVKKGARRNTLRQPGRFPSSSSSNSNHYEDNLQTSLLLASSSTSSSLLLSSIPQPSTHQQNDSSNRPRSSSASLLRMNTTHYQQQEQQQLIEEDTNMILPFVHSPHLQQYEDQEQSTSQRIAKYHFPSNGIKQGFAQLGAKLKSPGRDRSETV